MNAAAEEGAVSPGDPDGDDSSARPVAPPAAVGAPESVRDSGPPALAPEHAALIKASMISDDVARERGYRTVTKKVELEKLGFGDKQRQVPALLIPVFGPSGDRTLHQIRPDAPRWVDGKRLKYETPKGARLGLDVPPRARPWIKDPGRSLFVTEGVRKADAGVTAGLCVIDLLGVWGWRGSNEHGGKTALADWDQIALNGRSVFIVFDSDVMEKRSVAQALTRLKAFLEGRRATVRLIYLPAGEGGAKVGLDDYLAAGMGATISSVWRPTGSTRSTTRPGASSTR